MANALTKIIGLVLPSFGAASTPSYRPSYGVEPRLAIMSPPPQFTHRDDLFEMRQDLPSDQLIERMFSSDPDVSAAVNAYLTVANTEMVTTIRDLDGKIYTAGDQAFRAILLNLTHNFDLTKGYNSRPSFRRVTESLRWMCLLRGGIATELVVNALYQPTELRIIDSKSLRWTESTPGNVKPFQVQANQPKPISLDIPTFFVALHRSSPLTMYSTSPFVSAINTIAARTEVIQTLYRIMKVTGMPRLDIKVLEQVITNSAPMNIKSDPKKLREFITGAIGQITSSIANIKPDEAMVHSDASEVKILNDKNPGLGIDIQPAINVLNAQNTAALKSVATILGRGESGTNTASVESRIFSLNADELNAPVAEVLSKAFTVAMQLAGFPVQVDVKFRPSEMRPATELEPMLAIKQGRWLEQLSYGLVSDEEYCLEILGRLPLPGQKALSGTGFLTPKAAADKPTPSPNADPMGRAMAPDNSNAHKAK